jgi:hypothetical protein
VNHELKTWPDPFEAVWTGQKRYEIREEDDRKFSVGDKLSLKEFIPHKPCAGTGRVWDNGDRTDCGCAAPHGEYTGRVLKAKVTYKTEGGEWGLPEELCVLSIKVVGRIKARRSKKAA